MSNLLWFLTGVAVTTVLYVGVDIAAQVVRDIRRIRRP